jgi:oxygen-independent coproporphyrinogen-3 oxidase
MVRTPDSELLLAARHVYIHVPFCMAKCAYCSFYSQPWREPLADRYLDALGREMDSVLARTRPKADTIYVGGGTPTMLSDTQLDRLLETISSRVSTSRGTEWTVEANPGTLSPKRIAMMVDAGVTRISLGVQSFLDSALRTQDRPHSVSDVDVTCRMLDAQGFRNFGLDLIAGLPGVSREAWFATLARARDIAPRHMSIYALTLDRGTRLASAVKQGAVTLPDEAAVQYSLDIAATVLSKARYVRYEVSNFAQPGCECRHNLSFWRGGDYLGFGPAAASRMGRLRRKNKPDLRAYIEAAASGRRPPATRETLDDETDRSERLAFAFRLTEGADPSAYAGDGPPAGRLLERWTAALEGCSADGLVQRRNGVWVPTERGMRFADTVAERILPG